MQEMLFKLIVLLGTITSLFGTLALCFLFFRDSSKRVELFNTLFMISLICEIVAIGMTLGLIIAYYSVGGYLSTQCVPSCPCGN